MKINKKAGLTRIMWSQDIMQPEIRSFYDRKLEFVSKLPQFDSKVISPTKFVLQVEVARDTSIVPSRGE